MTARVPPNSLDSERAVLGSVLMENRLLDDVLSVPLTADDFYSGAHQLVFATMKSIYERGMPIDSITLRNALVENGKQRELGDELLMSLTETIPTVANALAHAKIVREKSKLREVIITAHRIAAEGYGAVEDVTAFLDRAGRDMQAATDVSGKEDGAQHISDIVTGMFEDLVKRAEQGTRLCGPSTGLEKLDDATLGLCPGELIVVGGRPGMGKSALVQLFIESVAKQGLPAYCFSLEMPNKQWAARMISSESRVNGYKIRNGDLQREDWPLLTRAAGAVSDLPIWIDDTPGLTIFEMRRRIRRYRAKHGKLGLIALDYLQLATGANGDNREQQISEISRNLKGLAKEQECPVVALSQLNRGVEKQSNKRPTMADLRESGAIEQDADTILLVYREEAYSTDAKHAGLAEIIIGKQRQGSVGTVHVGFDKKTTTFRNLETRHAEAEGWR